MLERKLILRNTRIQVPGDKSLSHRSVLLSFLNPNPVSVTNFLEAEDPLNTMASMQKLGLNVQKTGPGSYQMQGPPKNKAFPRGVELDFGNAGTGIRLASGLLCGLDGVEATLTGDESLRKRPMARIIDPLLEMGANIESVDKTGKAPLHIQGRKLQDFQYSSKIASAQVKSALIFAALASDVSLDYDEVTLSRNHTENMLRYSGVQMEYLTETHFKMHPPYELHFSELKIPGDISSAAFFIVLALTAKEGSITIEGVGLNPARIGILEILKQMGGRIEIHNLRQECGEEVGDLHCFSSKLQKVEIASDWIPKLIDEIPILTIAGLFAKGGFSIRNAKELRAKESDRISAMVSNLQNLGVEVTEYEDGYEFIEVERIQPSGIQTFMDHRLAMSFAVLEELTAISLDIDGLEWAETSFPGFFPLLQEVV